MPVTSALTPLCRLSVLAIALAFSACSVPQPPANRYEVEVASTQSEALPVEKLQNQALTAIDAEQFQLAQNYLQRAIKIQPRNAWSWHYLARTYWHNREYQRCLDMIERSESYGAYDDPLRGANGELRIRCQQG